jgi:hypothetical protein
MPIINHIHYRVTKARKRVGMKKKFRLVEKWARKFFSLPSSFSLKIRGAHTFRAIHSFQSTL